jgi:hypothetical protein
MTERSFYKGFLKCLPRLLNSEPFREMLEENLGERGPEILGYVKSACRSNSRMKMIFLTWLVRPTMNALKRSSHSDGMAVRLAGRERPGLDV